MRKEAQEDLAILGKEALPHLWKDELGDVFLLTRFLEIYAYSKTVLGCYCWSRRMYLQLSKMGVIFDIRETDDPLYCFRTNRVSLPLLLSLGAFRRRPHLKGKWLREKERLLGHRIIPCHIKISDLSALHKIQSEGGEE